MFKNLAIFQIGMRGQTAEQLTDSLSAAPLTPPSAMNRIARGFVPFDNGEMVHRQAGCLMFTVGITSKLLPAAVVKAAAKERAAEVEKQQGHKVGRKQMRELVEQAIDALLPQAFLITGHTRAYIDLANGWLVINTTSAGKADEVIEILSKAAPDLVIKHLRTKMAPTTSMTNWLTNADAVPAEFTIDQDAELRATDDSSAKVRHVSHSLDGADTGEQLAAGMAVFKLGMTYADRVSFILEDSGRIKRLKLLDIVKDSAESGDDAEAQFAIDFELFTGEMKKLIPAMVAALGGVSD